MANRTDNLDKFTNQELIERYRFDRNGILFLVNLLEDKIHPVTDRSNSLSTLEKILITLRILATGGIQLNDADLHGVSQPTVSRVFTEVVESLASPDIISRFVKFSTTMQDLTMQSREFYGIAQFPKVVGVIDGTHIRIKAPSANEEEYVNRKAYHSINVQLVFDAFDVISDVVARWPGSTHDSRILQHSGLRMLFEGGHLPPGQFHLLGDSGYGCKRWLLTPYLNPLPGAQTAYNRAHKKTRAKVERGIGQLKKRFGILHGEIRMEPSKVCRIILACAVLHNICKFLQIPIPELPNNYGGNIQPGPQQPIGPQEGLRYRDYIANTYF